MSTLKQRKIDQIAKVRAKLLQIESDKKKIRSELGSLGCSDPKRAKEMIRKLKREIQGLEEKLSSLVESFDEQYGELLEN